MGQFVINNHSHCLPVRLDAVRRSVPCRNRADAVRRRDDCDDCCVRRFPGVLRGEHACDALRRRACAIQVDFRGDIHRVRIPLRGTFGGGDGGAFAEIRRSRLRDRLYADGRVIRCRRAVCDVRFLVYLQTRLDIGAFNRR